VTNPTVEAARKTMTSIPIVMNQTTDPVATGYVASLARPGGNIAGLTMQSPDLAGKRLQFLKEAVPALSRVAVLSDPRYPGGDQIWSETRAAGPVLGLHLEVVKVRSSGALDDAFATLARTRAGAVLPNLGHIGFDHRSRIAELALK
jgi:putative ABC transport system substrate-binding protein